MQERATPVALVLGYACLAFYIGLRISALLACAAASGEAKQACNSGLLLRFLLI
jgi:hypothetical protein